MPGTGRLADRGEGAPRPRQASDQRRRVVTLVRHTPSTTRGIRRTVATALAAAAIAALGLAPATGLAADSVTVTFASGTSWSVEDADPGVGPSLALPGAAQHVCLNAGAPATCPGDATLFGWVGGGWSADLSAIPGATWIWAPGIDAATTPADSDTYRFARTISVPGTPQSGTAWVAADDGAEVFVNGTAAGSAAGQYDLAMLDITSLLVQGDNEIVVRGANNANCGGPCTYQANPAGVVFGGSISYAPTATPPPGGTTGPTARPRVTNPPTSTVDRPAAPSTANALGAVLLGTAAVTLAVLGMSRRVGRRQR
jgi:hypothetical protein